MQEREHSPIGSISAAMVALALSVVIATPLAAEYPVTQVISSTVRAPLHMLNRPALNNQGNVAFTGRIDDDLNTLRVFLVRGGTAETLHQFPALQSGVHSLSLNDNNQVFYHFTAPQTESLLMTAPGTPVTLVADDSGAFDRFGFFLRLPFITTTGTPAFEAVLDDSSYGIYRGGHPVDDRVVGTPGPFPGIISLQSARHDGTILFRAVDPTTGNTGIYKGPNPATDLVLDLGKSFTNVNYYQENARGDIVFTGNGDIFTGTDPIADLFAGRAGPFQQFLAIELNELGTIAFDANLDAGGRGVFLGPDPVADKVIATGDPLFGSTVSFARMWEGGLNDRNEIAFEYSLTNGEHGIAIVTVPEPATGVLLTSIVIACAARPARRRNPSI